MKQRKQLAKKLNGRFAEKQDELDRRPAVMGDGAGNLHVTGFDNFVYVTMGDKAVPVFNNRVPPQTGLQVWVGYAAEEPTLFQVLSTRSETPAGVQTGFVGYAPARRYEWMARNGGQDPLSVHLRAFTPLKLSVSPEGWMFVDLYRGFVYSGGAYIAVPRQNVDLYAQIPTTAGKAAFVLITIDTTGAVVQTKGSEVNIEDLVITDIPAVPAGTAFVCGAVRVYYGQLEIQEGRTNTDFVDLRFPGYAGGGLWQPLDSDLTAIAGLSPANDDVIQRKAGAWVNRTIAQLVTDIRTIIDLVFAPIAKGVTNGDSHDHIGGDGAAISLTAAVAGILPAANGGTGANNGAFVLTIPATGTAALLATANVFTANQKINVNSTAALLVEQDGVKDNVLVVDTTNGLVGLGTASPEYLLSVYGAAALANIRRSTDVAASGSGLLIDRSRGTTVLPTAILAGDVIGKVQFRGHNGTIYSDASFFQVVALTNFASSISTYFDLQTPTANIFRLSNMKVSAAFAADEAMNTIQFYTGDDTGARVAASIAHISDFAGSHGTPRGGLQFNTSVTGAISEAMRITNGGLVGIGGIPTAKFQVTGVADVVQSRTRAFSTQTSLLDSWETSLAAVVNSMSLTAGTVLNEQGDAAIDLRAESDTEANMLFLDSSADALYLGGSTNGVKILKGGELSLIGTATVWDDLRISPDVKGTGSKDPTWSAWLSGLYLYDFDNATAGSEKELWFNVQMPHGWKEGSSVYPHVHWVNDTAGTAGQVVRWGLEYTVAKIGGTFPAVTTIYGTTIAGGGDITVANEHMITSFDPITMTGNTISTILVCRLFRNSSDAADTYGGTAGLLSIDWHFEIDKIGSSTEFA